jgi:signal transduction histidine kinase
VPILSGNRILGVITVCRHSPGHLIGDLDIELLEAFARHAALAIEGSRLYDRAEHRAYELAREVEAQSRELQATRVRLTTTEHLAWLGQLAAGIGHEIRSPLSVIKNAAYYLNVRLTDADEAVRRNLDMIRQEVIASEKIVGHLLDFSRGRMLKRLPIDLNSLVKSTIEELSIPSHISLTTSLSREPISVSGDGELLARVIVNLAMNAIQAMPTRGTLSIATFLSNDSSKALLEVSDTGKGIPSENIDKIFEPLFTTKAKGMGLGLALCRMLVQAHGGEIDVTSEAGKGTTFMLSLPLDGHSSRGTGPGEPTATTDS